MPRIADLILERGNALARGQERSGQIWGNAVSNIGQTFGQTVAQIPQQREEEQARQRQQAEDVELRRLFAGPELPRPEAVMSVVGPERGMPIVQGLAAFDELRTKRVTDARSTAGRIAIAMKQFTPELRAEFWPAVRQAAIAGQLGDEHTLPAEPTDEFLDGVIGWSTGKEPEQPKAAGTREIKTRNADGSESVQIVEDTPGQTFTSAPAPEKGPEAGTFGDYLKREASVLGVGLNDLTPGQVLNFRKRYQQADDTKDPLLAELREMRIEEMKRRVNSPDMSPAVFNMANKLADDFTRDSKDYIARSQSYATVQGAAKDTSPAGDLSIIFAYMKMLDPGSVVREGEFATAQNTAGVPDRIRNAYNKVINGERLSTNQRADFLNQAGNIYRSAKRMQTTVVQTYTQRAQRASVPIDMVVMDYGARAEPDPPAGALSVQAPNGKTYSFPTQAQADAFKKAAGIP